MLIDDAAQALDRHGLRLGGGFRPKAAVERGAPRRAIATRCVDQERADAGGGEVRCLCRLSLPAPVPAMGNAR